MKRMETYWVLALAVVMVVGCGKKADDGATTTEQPPVVDLPGESQPGEPSAPAQGDSAPGDAAVPPAATNPAPVEDKPATPPDESDPPTTGPALGNPAPDGQSSIRLEVKDYDGLLAHIREQSGKVVVLDCWSTYCDECLTAFPGLVALHTKYGPEKVACMSLSFDYVSGDVNKVKPGVQAELERLGATFANFVSNESDTVLYEKFDFPAVPAVFVYDQQGKLVKRFDNSDPKAPAFRYADVDALVEELLAGKQAAL